jgi:hypothetical protein
MAWESQDLLFSQKVIELIKHHGDKVRTYDIIPLNWGINNYDVYNRNELYRDDNILYLYNFYFNSKFK